MRKVEVKTKRNKEKVWKSSVDAGEIVNGEFLPFFENPKLKNVEEKAEELIGLRYEQFVQVMVLPQGKFEQFLTSKSEEKQEILKTLFQMEHWENINAWLVEYIKQEKQKLDDLQGKQQIYLETLKEESIEQAKATMDSLKTELEEKKKELIKQNKKVACLEKELVEQKQRNEDEQAFETCRKELDTLQEKQGAINAQKEKQGQASDIEITAREIQKLKKELYTIIADHSHTDFDKVWADSDRDYWMTAQEAKEYGMIDEVLIKK